MNYDSIIQKLLTSTALLKIMSNNYSIKGILLGGSRLLELESPQSDYDLNILIEESDFQTWNFYTKSLSFPPIYFKVEDKLVHWYYTSDVTLPSSSIQHRDFWVIES